MGLARRSQTHLSGEVYAVAEQSFSLPAAVLLCAGVIIAAELNRTVILPRLLLNGTQPTEAEVNENTSGSVPFGWVRNALKVRCWLPGTSAVLKHCHGGASLFNGVLVLAGTCLMLLSS